MSLSAVKNADGTITIDSSSGTSQTYPVGDVYFTTPSTDEVYLWREDTILCGVTSFSGQYTGNSIFGATTPAAVRPLIVNTLQPGAASQGGVLAAADITSGVNSSAIPALLQQLVTASTKRYELTLLQDSSGSLFLSRFDQSAGTSITTALDGTTPYVPTGPISAPDKEETLVVKQTTYQALTAKPQWDIGDQLTRIFSRAAQVDTAIWLNDTRGTVLSGTLPALPTDAKPTDDYIYELVALIESRLLQINQTTSSQVAFTKTYRAATNSAAWAQGDELLLLDFRQNGLSSGYDVLVWYNATTATLISGSSVDPVAGVDAIIAAVAQAETFPYLQTRQNGQMQSEYPTSELLDPDRIALHTHDPYPASTVATIDTVSLLDLILSRLQATLAVSLSTVPLDKSFGSTQAATVRTVSSNDDPVVLAVGNATDVSLSPNEAAASTLKGVIRGLWSSVKAILGDTGDLSVASNYSGVATLKGLLRLLIFTTAGLGSLVSPTAGGIAAGTVLVNPLDTSGYKQMTFTLTGSASGLGSVQVQQSDTPGFLSFEVLQPRKLSDSSYSSIDLKPAGTYTVALSAAKYTRVVVGNAYSGGTLTVSACTISYGDRSDSGVIASDRVFVGPLSLSSPTSQLLTSDSTILGAVDCRSYNSGVVTVNMTGSATAGVIVVEGSNDGTNFRALQLVDSNYEWAPILLSDIKTFGPSSVRQFRVETPYRYVRARIASAIVGATVSCSVRFSNQSFKLDGGRSMPPASKLQAVSLASAGTAVAVAAPAAGLTLYFCGATVCSGNTAGQLEDLWIMGAPVNTPTGRILSAFSSVVNSPESGNCFPSTPLPVAAGLPITTYQNNGAGNMYVTIYYFIAPY